MRETWLNGWTRSSIYVHMGVTTYCAGCGRERGMITAVIDDDYTPPPQLPDWPFEPETCPVCALFDGLQLPLIPSPEQLATFPLSTLRQALAIKKQQAQKMRHNGATVIDA